MGKVVKVKMAKLKAIHMGWGKEIASRTIQRTSILTLLGKFGLYLVYLPS